MDGTEIRRQLDEARTNRERLFGEVENLKAREQVDGTSDGLAERMTNLHRGIENADNRIAELEGAFGRDLLAGYRDGRYHAEAGAPPAPERRDEQPRGQRNETRDQALRTVERYSARMDAGAADTVDGLIRRDGPGDWTSRYLTAVGSEHYRSAFAKLVTDSQFGHLKMNAQEVEAVRVAGAVNSEREMSIGVTSAGGFAVPFTLDPSIILSSAGVADSIRGVARVETVATNVWKGVSSDGVTATFSQEAAAMVDGSPVLAQPVVTCERFTCFVPFSWELAQDWSTLERELARLASDARSTMESTAFWTGAGTASFQPQGLATGLALNGVTQQLLTTGTAAIAATDLWGLKALIPPRFASTTTFAAAPATWDRIYRTTPPGGTIEPQVMPTRDGEFLGRPRVEWSSVGTISTSGTCLVGGDFSGYLIADRLGLTAVPIPALLSGGTRPTGQAGIAYFGRTGGAVINASAFRLLVGR